LKALLLNIEKYVVVLDCTCGIKIGIDKLSMVNFIALSFHLHEEMNDAISKRYSLSKVSPLLESWRERMKLYDMVVHQAVTDVHGDKQSRCCLGISEFKSDVLSERRLIINRIKTTINQLTTLDSVERIKQHNEHELMKIKHACHLPRNEEKTHT
jgi:hypothetical protein